MFERLKFLYEQKRLTDAMLEVAVSKTWITAQEKAEIIASVSLHNRKIMRFRLSIYRCISVHKKCYNKIKDII